MRGLRRFMLSVLIAAFVVLLTGALLVLLFEDAMIYHPRPLAAGRLAELVAGLDPGDGTFEEVELKTGDGEMLVAWLGRPPGEPVGWLVWFHGNAGSIEHRFPELVRFVREARLAVLLPDYRGFGRSTGRPSEAGLYRDGTAALDFLAARGVPSESVTLLGRSLGGAVAIEIALRRPVKALVLDGAFSSVRDMAKVTVPFFPAAWFVRTRFANDEKLGRITVPILHFHGRRDEIVPFSQAEKLRRSAPASGYEFVAVDSGHLDLSDRMGSEYYERIAALAGGD